MLLEIDEVDPAPLTSPGLFVLLLQEPWSHLSHTHSWLPSLYCLVGKRHPRVHKSFPFLFKKSKQLATTLQTGNLCSLCL
jgi:hypothetical protein